MKIWIKIKEIVLGGVAAFGRMNEHVLPQSALENRMRMQVANVEAGRLHADIFSLLETRKIKLSDSDLQLVEETVCRLNMQLVDKAEALYLIREVLKKYAGDSKTS